MNKICVTEEYIKMLIGLLETDGKDSKKIVKKKLENLIGEKTNGKN